MTTHYTIDSLSHAVDSCDANPVEVAGYGRESTHKGYLSNILNTHRWPSARVFVQSLFSATSVASTHGNVPRVQSLWTGYEERFGGGKVDLVVHGQFETSVEFHLPIELKTDSDVSKDQANSYANQAQDQNPSMPVLVFALGSSAVRSEVDETSKVAAVLSPQDLLTVISPLLNEAPRAVRDWADALELEICRQSLAPAVYCQWQHSGSDAALWKCGYRSWKNLYYYLNDFLNRRFVERGFDLQWSTYDGGYNTVLAFKANNWRSLRSCFRKQFRVVRDVET